MNKTRYKQKCVYCNNWAIYAIQTHFTNSGKPHTLKTVQLRVKPVLCEDCIKNWDNAEIFVDSVSCKHRIVEIANNRDLYIKTVVFLRNSRAEKFISTVNKV